MNWENLFVIFFEPVLIFLARALLFWNGIVTKSAPGMATADSSCSQPQTFDRSMNFECFDHISGACWIVPAGIRKNRADDPLVNFYRDDQYRNKKLSDIFHVLLPCKVT